MARRKIGWRMKLRRELRQARQEEKIRARDLKKREKQVGKILDGVDVDAVKEQSAKIGAASKQLQEQGYEPTTDPIETMVQYNDVNGEGSGEEVDENAPEAFESFDSLESLDENENTKANAYGNVLKNLGEIISNFEENFSKNNSEDLESYEENFGKKIKEGIGKFLGGGKGGGILGKFTGGGKDSSNATIEEIANDIQTFYPQKAERLKVLAKSSGAGSKGIVFIFIAGIAGFLLGKFLKF